MMLRPIRPSCFIPRLPTPLLNTLPFFHSSDSDTHRRMRGRKQQTERHLTGSQLFLFWLASATGSFLSTKQAKGQQTSGRVLLRFSRAVSSSLHHPTRVSHAPRPLLHPAPFQIFHQSRLVRQIDKQVLGVLSPLSIINSDRSIFLFMRRLYLSVKVCPCVNLFSCVSVCGGWRAVVPCASANKASPAGKTREQRVPIHQETRGILSNSIAYNTERGFRTASIKWPSETEIKWKIYKKRKRNSNERIEQMMQILNETKWFCIQAMKQWRQQNEGKSNKLIVGPCDFRVSLNLPFLSPQTLKSHVMINVHVFVYLSLPRVCLFLCSSDTNFFQNFFF